MKFVPPLHWDAEEWDFHF
jgi:hypothetical protein